MRAEELWCRAFDSLRDGFAIHDKDRRIIKANRALSELLGVPPKKLLGAKCFRVFHNRRRPIEKCPATECMLSKKPECHLEFYEPHLSSWLSISVYPIFNENDEIIGYLHMARDITESKRAEEELVKRTKEIIRQKELIERITEGIEEGLLLLSKDLRIQWANRKFREITGYVDKELLERHCYEVTHNRNEKCEPEPYAMCPIDEAMETGMPVSEVHIHYDKNGKEFFAESTAYPLKENGEVVGFIYLIKDITDRMKDMQEIKRLKEFNEEIVEHSPMGIIRLDRDLKVIYENPKMKEILGVPKGTNSKAIGIDIREVPSVVKAGISDVFSKLQRGQEIRVEVPFVSIYGKESILSCVGVPLFEDGYFSGAVLMVEEITERKKTEEELRKAHAELKIAYEELKTLDKMKDEFLSNVSHELRTPLTSIKGAFDLLDNEMLSIEQKELVFLGKQNANRLNELIGDILYYAKMEYLAYELKEDEFDLGKVIEASVRAVTPMALNSGISLETETKGELGLVGDKNAIFKVLSNLLSNAIKFNKKGGKVIVKAGVENGRIKVIVSDTGIGIPKDHLSKIFRKFYQVNGSTKRKYPGAGLGLSIAQTIVEKHGGKIWAESEVNKGSKFIFEIPKRT